MGDGGCDAPARNATKLGARCETGNLWALVSQPGKGMGTAASKECMQAGRSAARAPNLGWSTAVGAARLCLVRVHCAALRCTACHPPEPFNFDMRLDHGQLAIHELCWRRALALGRVGRPVGPSARGGVVRPGGAGLPDQQKPADRKETADAGPEER